MNPPTSACVPTGHLSWIVPALWLAQSVMEAYLGKRAKDGKSPYGSVLGAIVFFVSLLIWTFTYLYFKFKGENQHGR